MIYLDFKSNKYKIKSVDIEEVPYVQQWFNCNQIKNKSYSTTRDIKEFYETFFASYLSKKEFFGKIFMNDEFVGIIKGRVEEKELWFDFIMIDVLNRGKGIGSEILKATIKYFKDKLNTESVYAGIFISDDKLMKFWQNNGFNKVREIDNYYKFGEIEKNGVIFKLEK